MLTSQNQRNVWMAYLKLCLTYYMICEVTIPSKWHWSDIGFRVYIDVNTREVGRTRDKRRKLRREAEWFPAYGFQLFFYKITYERGTKTVFTYAHVLFYKGELSTSERTKYRGSIRHCPPPHPPLVDNYFVLETSSSVVKLHLKIHAY